MTIDARCGRWGFRLRVGLVSAVAAMVMLPGGIALAAPTGAPDIATPVAAAQRDRAVWETHGHPTAMTIVRQTSVDLVDHGRLTQRIPRWGGDMTIPMLSRYLPRSWLSVTGGTARLSAAVVITPNLTLDVGAPIKTLQLSGGATAADAASLYTGGGGLRLRGVTVTAVDRTSRQAMAPGAGRPFIVVSPGGRLTATDSTISDLGSEPTEASSGADVQNHPGVDFHAGSTGALVRTSVLRNGTGLSLNGSQGVHLEDVTVGGSKGVGLVLRGDRATTMSKVRADHNGTYGVRIMAPSTDRPITGISTTGNGTFGIGVLQQTAVKITDVTTSADGIGGLDVSESANATISGLTATAEPVGIFTHVNSTNVVLDRLAITGGGRGVMIEKTTDHLVMRASTITGATGAGVSAGGKNVDLRDSSVTGSRSGVRVERGAHGLTAAGLTLSGGLDGVVASPGTDGVVLQDLTVNGVADVGVRSSSPDARIVGGRITGGSTGIAVDAATTISGTQIGLVDQGIRSQSPGLVHADDIVVNAVSVGINAANGSPFLLTGSHIHALESVRGALNTQGPNDVSLPPLNLLGAIGLPLVLIAVALQVVAALRGRRFGGDARPTPPVRPTVSDGPARQHTPVPAA
jgi:hypothetical protein